MKDFQVAIVLVIAGMVVIGTAYSTMSSLPVSHGGPVKDYVSLVDTLRAKGLKVEPAERIYQPFFTMQAQVILVDGHSVQVYEYPDESTMNAEASKVSSDGGSIGDDGKTMMISWIEQPHFYKTGKIMVIYVGRDPTILAALDSTIGTQFAGRSEPTGNSRGAEEAAKAFIAQAPTFKFDGLPETLTAADTKTMETFPEQHIVTITFESRTAGYGDRTGKILAQVITPHEAQVRVTEGKVVSAILDGRWDEIKQQPIPQGQQGTIIGKVTIGPLCPVEPCPNPTQNVYSTRTITLRSATGNTTSVPLNSDGHFQAKVNPGTYELNLTDCTFLGCRTALPKTIKIEPNTTTKTDIDIDTGIR
ncbi:MAG: hypothetical protein HYU39_09780 [Thaumarchaeota archaeon]|nr:hypothetical protein [Nitrososphaerota archaeon]